jgi:short-subunit dehydrogenase involved in D-alanine esterification of teichoic acids
MRVFQDGLLTGKTAFLTGGTSGIGLGMAQRFGEMGARVFVVGRNAQKLEAARAAIPGEAGGAAADVRDYAALRATSRRR